MLYFSEIRNAKVTTKSGQYVGQLDDLIFIVADEPFVTKCVIKTPHGLTKIFALNVMQFNQGSFILEDKHEEEELAVNELYILKNVLDKQVLDIQGNKIVRVNDIVIQDKPRWLVAGVDIGFLGIVRWFNLEGMLTGVLSFFDITLIPRLLSWADIHPLELARGKVVLKKTQNKLKKIRPEDLADHLETTNINNASKLLMVLDDEFAAEVIGNLHVTYQNALFQRFSPEKAAKVVQLVDPDEAVDIILTLPAKKRERIMDLLTKEKRKEIEYLLDLSKTPIGELITSEFLTVPSDYTVRKAIDAIKKGTSDFSFLNYLYVVNKENQLVGVVNLHEILMESLDSPMYRFMNQNMIVAHLITPEEIAIKRMLKYKIHALPVIDKNKRMLGIITYDDVAEYLSKQLRI